MKPSLTRQDLLDDIEYELTQSALLHSDLGRSVEAVRRYQSKLRSEIFGIDNPKPNQHEAISRLFQVNELQLTLLQEMAKAIDAQDFARSRAPARTALSLPEHGMAFDSVPIMEAMRLETLTVNPGVIPSHLPLLGVLITRFKSALHRVTLYYLDQLAAKQYGVNKVFGTAIMQLQQAMLAEHQELASMRTELSALEKRVSAREQMEQDKPCGTR